MALQNVAGVLTGRGFMDCLQYFDNCLLISGFGVFSKTPFEKGDFLLEYAGERISIEEAEVRERKNPANMMFYFSYNGKRQCIDASGECSHICQYVNDNHNGNSVMKLRVINKVARLCLFAKKDINYGEEILYDYGDKQSLWWRKKTRNIVLKIHVTWIRLDH
ncbi:N-lysine methyltransferase KMT5A-like isoform X2 [Ruditapes philippinarum]|uniref:N-lysine methyltransferase KMT5A-like isoform X2 n=1 Tax=Ruditapes philippinarum TaxID=129788 RepID=UPI00295C282B|nr:N-lysine methyltransferase KMT5A-like isoform X2 [Ruditapes philippinarum]